MKASIDKPLIFISYRAEDEELARALAEGIRRDFLGYPEVFYDSVLEPGNLWKEEIKDCLKRASLVCVLYSERPSTHWISMEVGAAWITEAELIPICYGSLKKSDLPDVLAERQAIEAGSRADIERLYGRIAKILKCTRPPVSEALTQRIRSFLNIYKPMSDKAQYQSLPDRQRAEEYLHMNDGTIKAINPMTGTLVWTVSGRKKRPSPNIPDIEASALDKAKTTEDYCVFCESNYFATPPEKSRIEIIDGEYKMKSGLAAKEVFQGGPAEFRRVPNLFAILSYDYWVQNHVYEPDETSLRRQERYTETPEGREHVESIVAYKRKLGASGKSIEPSLFFESHDLVIARRHYRKDAKMDDERSSSGDLSPEEHCQYFRITIDAAKDLYARNRYVKYVAVFQNWLTESGATIDHLHKQLVGIDEFGLPVERMAKKKSGYFNERVEFASKHNLLLVENAHALAYVDPGRRYPTIAVFSKRLHDLMGDGHSEAIRGMSDLVRACHAAVGNDIATNEEWYYTPPSVETHIPWHVLILLRTTVAAGFEHATRIHINPCPSFELRNQIVSRLRKMESRGLLGDIDIRDRSDVPQLEY